MILITSVGNNSFANSSNLKCSKLFYKAASHDVFKISKMIVSQN